MPAGTPAPRSKTLAFINYRSAGVPPGVLLWSLVSVVNAKWLDYRNAGPIVVSLDHRGTGDGKPLRIFFTDVAVKLAGSDTWVNESGWNARVASMARPATQQRIKTLIDRGFCKPGDAENRLGDFVGQPGQ
jgi:hypothetical protein